jgi:hypothetical protein
VEVKFHFHETKTLTQASTWWVAAQMRIEKKAFFLAGQRNEKPASGCQRVVGFSNW